MNRSRIDAEPVRIAIVEDDAEIRGALELLISGTSGYVCAGGFGDCESAIDALSSLTVDVLLMDITLPGMTGIEGVRVLRERFQTLDIIMLTVHDDDRSVFDSLCAGACGYLVKTTHPAKILAAIEEVHRGGAPMSPSIARMVASSFRKGANSPLTPRETEILQQVCVGKSYKMIASELFISQETVHSHLKNIYRKLEVSSKTEAMAKAFRERWI